MSLLLPALITYTLFIPIIQNIPPPPQRGIFINPTYRQCADLHTLGAEWYIDDQYPITGCDVEFVPRYKWLGTPAIMDEVIANAQPGGWIATLDEPNLAGISPYDGAVWYHYVEARARPLGLKILAPVPSQHNPEWLWLFVDSYTWLYGAPPQIDAFGWNMFYSTPGQITGYITARHNEALARGYEYAPHWVTSYGGECWLQNGQDGNEAVIWLDAWFEQQEWIDRYAWFGTRINGSEAWALGWESCSLLDTTTGQRTALGELYR